LQAFAQAFCVEEAHAEDAVAALGAAGVAGEPVAAAGGGVGECGVGDLDEFVVTGWAHVCRVASSPWLFLFRSDGLAVCVALRASRQGR